jgi:hypothetical protein
MAARTADPAFAYPSLTAKPADRECSAVTTPQAPIPDDHLGAFRGLAFAIIFQSTLGGLALAAWEVLRKLL